MDMIESIDIVFKNLHTNILKSNGNSLLIEQYIKDTQHIVLCYTLSSQYNDLDIINPRMLTKNCVVE